MYISPRALFCVHCFLRMDGLYKHVSAYLLLDFRVTSFLGIPFMVCFLFVCFSFLVLGNAKHFHY